MGWNHRVLAHQYESLGEICYDLRIHEVYYDKEGKPDAYTANSVGVNGESLRDIEWTLKHMLECLEKPILWEGERFPEEFKETINL